MFRFIIELFSKNSFSYKYTKTLFLTMYLKIQRWINVLDDREANFIIINFLCSIQWIY